MDTTQPKNSPNCLMLADSLVSGPRNDDYGHPLDDFSRTAALWSAVLGVEVTPEQVALCMIQVKVSREINKPKADNVVDIAGYSRTLEMVKEEKIKRSKSDATSDPYKGEGLLPTSRSKKLEESKKEASAKVSF